jgi:peptidoglycan/LPS O-acetylase OafA/YrhL
MPILVWFLMREPTAWKAFTLSATVFFVGLVLRGHIWLHDLTPVVERTTGPDSFNNRFLELIYYPTWTRLDDLVAGVTLAMARSFRPALWGRLMKRADLLTLSGLVVTATAIWLLRDHTAFIPIVFGYPLLSVGLACLVASAAGPQSFIGRHRVPGAKAIATMAYSLYLTHKQTYHLVQLVLGKRLHDSPVFTILVFGGAAMVGGAILYLSIERPFIRLRDRLHWPAGSPLLAIQAAEERGN